MNHILLNAKFLRHGDARKDLAISIANSLADNLVEQGRLTEDQGNFIFDRLTDVLMELDISELMTYIAELKEEHNERY